ncbi:Uncharacterised protein [Citrobacter koseri]|nr:Uncharacterised protein [Citrobacter koseri]
MKKLILAAFIAMTAGAAMAENEQIVFSTPNLAMPFEVHMQRTAVKAAKEMGVSLQFWTGREVRRSRLPIWKTLSPVAPRDSSSPRMMSTQFPARWMRFRTLSCRW